MRNFLSSWTQRRLGSPIESIRFRAGRIDSVWAVRLDDGRDVVIKTYRPPADRTAIEVSTEAQRLLAGAGFPCAVPLAGPEPVDGRMLRAETLIEGTTPDGNDPANRMLLAQGLVEHIRILGRHPQVVRRAGPGPSWCQYRSGPWPVPHDSIVDFRSTPAGFEWLDGFGTQAADQILAHRDPDAVVAGHADWYAGNTTVRDGILIGSFDWELVADTEPVIAGFAAACYAASSTGSQGLSDPGSVTTFMRDYETAREQRLTISERCAAAAAAAWIIAFNARWQVGLIGTGYYDEAPVALARDHAVDYLHLSW